VARAGRHKFQRRNLHDDIIFHSPQSFRTSYPITVDSIAMRESERRQILRRFNRRSLWRCGDGWAAPFVFSRARSGTARFDTKRSSPDTSRSTPLLRQGRFSRDALEAQTCCVRIHRSALRPRPTRVRTQPRWIPVIRRPRHDGNVLLQARHSSTVSFRDARSGADKRPLAGPQRLLSRCAAKAASASTTPMSILGDPRLHSPADKRAYPRGHCHGERTPKADPESRF
jgi:hypothetical protein